MGRLRTSKWGAGKWGVRASFAASFCCHSPVADAIRFNSAISSGEASAASNRISVAHARHSAAWASSLSTSAGRGFPHSRRGHSPNSGQPSPGEEPRASSSCRPSASFVRPSISSSNAFAKASSGSSTGRSGFKFSFISALYLTGFFAAFISPAHFRLQPDSARSSGFRRSTSPRSHFTTRRRALSTPLAVRPPGNSRAISSAVSP